MQLYRKIMITKKTGLMLKSVGAVSFDAGDILLIVPEGKQGDNLFSATPGQVGALVREGFAEYIDPAQIEQTKIPTRSEIDDAFTRLGDDLLQWEKEKDLRRRSAAHDAETDILYDALISVNARTAQLQSYYLEHPNDAARSMFRDSTINLEGAMEQYYATNAPSRALRAEWQAYAEECAAKSRENLLARLDYVKGLMMAQGADAAGDQTERDILRLAKGLFSGGRIGSVDVHWDLLIPEVQAEWIAKARAQIESEIPNDR